MSATPEDAPSHQGKLIIDATVAEQAIRYPTDLGLLNEAREITEQVIDTLYPHTELKQKPRTYRRQARKAFLGFGILRRSTSPIHAVVGFGILRRSTSPILGVVGLVKQRRPKRQATRRAIRQQLQYLRRNLGHIEQ